MIVYQQETCSCIIQTKTVVYHLLFKKRIFSTFRVRPSILTSVRNSQVLFANFSMLELTYRLQTFREYSYLTWKFDGDYKVFLIVIRCKINFGILCYSVIFFWSSDTLNFVFMNVVILVYIEFIFLFLGIFLFIEKYIIKLGKLFATKIELIV